MIYHDNAEMLTKKNYIKTKRCIAEARLVYKRQTVDTQIKEK